MKSDIYHATTTTTLIDETDVELRAPLPLKHYPDVNPKDRPIVLDYLCRIYVASHTLKLDTETRFTSMVIFHRFICHYSFPNHHHDDDNKDVTTSSSSSPSPLLPSSSNYDRYYLGKIAAVCLFLGCKMNEDMRRIRDVINLSRMLQFCEELPPSNLHHHSAMMTEEEADDNGQTLVHIIEASCPPDLNAEYWSQKDEIVSLEQEILRTIQFDTCICHPHRAVLVVLDFIIMGGQKKESDDGEYNNRCLGGRRRNVLVKNAWRILNDASFHLPSLRYPVMVMACAVLRIAMNDYCDGNSERGDDDQKQSMTLKKEEVNSMEEDNASAEDWWITLGVSDENLTQAIQSLKESSKLISALSQSKEAESSD